MPTDLKYFVYCRRSQDREDKQTLSIESQERELREFAKKNNLKIVDFIREDKSAYKRGRPKFNLMMEEIEKGKADGVLTWHLTRLARNGADGGLIISFMDEGKILELRTPEKAYYNTGDDKFMMTIHFAMAKKSSDDTSSFVKNNLKTKIINGEYPGVVPYGYLNIDTNGVISGKKFTNEKQLLLQQLNKPLKRIELDPIEAPIIRKLIDLALTGVYTAPMLQAEGYKLGLKGKHSKKGLAIQTIFNILSNVFYVGKFEWDGEVHRGIHEPLLTQAEFDRLQEILFSKSRPKLTKHQYTFISLVHCPTCNHRMSGEYQKGLYYYRCIRAKGRNPTCPNKKHIRQDSLDVEIEDTLQHLRVPTRVVDWSMKYLKEIYVEENQTLDAQRVLLERNIRDEKLKLERLTSKWLSPENTDGGLISDDEYKVQKTAIQNTVEHFEAQRTDKAGEEDNWLDRCEQFFMRLRNLATEYHQSDILGKRILLQAIGAKFIRKNEGWLVELEKPFSLVLETSRQVNLSELALSGISKPKIETHDPEILKWLPRLDSNQRPSG